VNFLINEIKIDPIRIFRYFESRLNNLSVDQRNNLEFEIFHSDLIQYLNQDNELFACSLLSFDQALRIVSLSNTSGGVLYSGNVQLVSGWETPRLVPSKTIRDYLLNINGDTINGFEISHEQSLLYELQGLPSIRSELIMQNRALKKDNVIQKKREYV
jgi:hypothetical protein